MHVVAAGEDLFLPVERKVIAVFAHEDLGQQSGRGQAAFAQALGQRRDDGSQIGVGAVNVFAADDPPAQEAAGFVIELFVHFLADAAPGLRRGLHRFGIDDLFDERKIFRQARGAHFAGTGRVRFRHGWQRLGRRRGAGGGGQLQEQFELRGIDGFTAGAENAAHERIDLLAQERVLLARLLQRRLQGGDEIPQLGQFRL